LLWAREVKLLERGSEIFLNFLKALQKYFISKDKSQGCFNPLLDFYWCWLMWNWLLIWNTIQTFWNNPILMKYLRYLINVILRIEFLWKSLTKLSINTSLIDNFPLFNLKFIYLGVKRLFNFQFQFTCLDSYTLTRKIKNTSQHKMLIIRSLIKVF
jgi:hypothetical protein